MYCTQCGRPLPSSGICPRCARRPPQGAAHPLGKTVYDFCESPGFLILALVWTLATAWAAFLILRVSPLPAPLFLPNALFCLGLWVTFFSRPSRGKRAGLGLASFSLLLGITMLAICLTVLCLIGFYGIFLCASDRDSNYLVPDFLRLVLVLFLLMPIGILFLNKLRKIVRSAQGTLRGNRGMAVCPVTSILFCVLFTAGGAFLALFAFDTQVSSGLMLMIHTLSRLPLGLNTLISLPEAMSWSFLIPILLGFSAALLITAIILSVYRFKLQRAKKAILRAGGGQPAAKRE